MDESLFCLEQQSPLFLKYVRQFPQLEREVTADLLLAFLVVGALDIGFCPPIDSVVAARDALFRLCGVADGAGFSDVSSFFYEAYEVVCGRIASYQR